MKDKKNLSQKEVASLLGLPLITIQRWEHQGKIPYKIIDHEKGYKKKEILDWAKRHDLAIKSFPRTDTKQTEGVLSAAIRRGGIHTGIEGRDVYTVFEAALKKLPFISFTDRERVFNELLYREELASTGIGKGIAIPHTRNRLDLGLEETAVALFFLENDIDYNALDGLPVNILFMIFTANTRDHLKILSKISFLLQDQELLAILGNKNKEDDLFDTIIKKENAS